MKHKLLSLMALVGAMFVSASAMAWEKPAEVTPTFDATKFVAPVDGGVYFLYNVGAEQFLGAGNDWGTHVVTMAVTEENPAHFWNEKVAFASGNNYVLPVILTKTNNNWYIEHMGSNRTDCYLSSEDGNSWIDCGTDRRIDFIITEGADGYTIQASNTVAANTFFGTAASDDGVAVRNVMNNFTETDNIIWKFCETNYAAYNAYDQKVALYNQLLIADSLGVSTTEAGAVYTNAAATAEEVKAAVEKLEAANRTKEMSNAFAEATVQNPMDVTTYVLKNANFDSGNVDGWDLGFTKGENCTNLGYQSASYKDKNGNTTISKFIEAWQKQPDKAALGDGSISQTVTGLPDGKYKLEVDVIAVNQANANVPAEGVYLFIKADDNEEKTLIQTGNGISEHITTYLDIANAQKVTFGLKTESTTANWMAADNFKVSYYGNTPASREMLALIETIKNTTDGTEVTVANSDTINAFNRIFDNAQKLVDNNEQDNEVVVQATKNLEAAYKALKGSASDYAKVMPYVEAADQLAEDLKTILIDYEDVVNDIIDMAADWRDGYENLSLTTADIAAMEGAAVNIFKENTTSDNIKVGADLTFLLRNADFTEGAGGRDLTGADKVPGWNITKGALTEHRIQSANIESYHNNDYNSNGGGFAEMEIQQVIKNMPAGVYDITVQGFVRHDGNITNGTKFFAGNTVTEFISLKDDATQASAEKIFKGKYTEEKGDANEDVAFAGDASLFQCNGMTGAYYWFREINPNTDEPFYTNHIKAILAEDGDLTIGIRSTTKTDWVIWSNFNIKYTGMDEEALRIMLDQGTADLAEIAKDPELFITQKGMEMADDAIDAANAALSADEMIAASQQLQVAKDYIIDGNREGQAMKATASSYLALFENESQLFFDKRNTQAGEFAELVAGYEAYTGMELKDNDEIATIVKNMETQWNLTVQQGSEVATKAAPFEVTSVIKSHNFTNLDGAATYDGWNVVKGSVAVAHGAIEAFNKDSVDVNQTINNLKPGFYTIDMRGMYRPGDIAVAYDNFKKEGKQRYNAFLYGRTFYSEEKFDSAWVHHIQTTLEGMKAGEKDTPYFAKDEETGQIADAVIYTIDTTFCAKDVEGAFAVRYDSISADSVDGKLVIKYDTIYASKLDTLAYTYAPNSMQGFMTWVNDDVMLDGSGLPLGLYHNTIGVEVGEDGTLQLGFREFAKLTNDWLITGDWRLYYLGQGEENRPDGIVANERTLRSIGQQFYSIDGRRQATLLRGVNIIRETLSNGTTRTRKVLVR